MSGHMTDNRYNELQQAVIGILILYARIRPQLMPRLGAGDFTDEPAAELFRYIQKYPDADAVIELGGEDAKIIFLTGGVEQRMNGSCAGGTGAFIDQMATLLGISADELDELSLRANKVYPIASRCGVFAKSDIQPLLNQGARREDIAASIFQAVVDQTVSGLAQGRTIEFTDNQGWGTAYIYVYGAEGEYAAWPGTPMTLKGDNGLGGTNYTYELPGDTAFFVFNNGLPEGADQTVDVYDDGVSTGWYPLGTRDETGKLQVGSWRDGDS